MKKKISSYPVISLVSFSLLGMIVVFSGSVALAATGQEYNYYKAGDGVDNWATVKRTIPVMYPSVSPAGATIKEVDDATKGHKVIETNSPNGTNGMDNSYELRAYDASEGACTLFAKSNDDTGCWDNHQQTQLNLEIKANGEFAIYVYLDTTSTTSSFWNPYRDGFRVIKYTSDDVDTDGREVDWTTAEKNYYSQAYFEQYGTLPSNSWGWAGGKTLHYGIGSDKADGNWHTIVRDIEADLQNLQPTNNLNDGGTRKVEIQGNVRINKVNLDFTDEMFNRMDKYEVDTGWAYDTGWLDTSELRNPSGKTTCDGVNSGNRTSCSSSPTYNGCRGIHHMNDSIIEVDTSDLPSPMMDKCYLVMNSEYTFDGSGQGVQPDETTFVTVDTGLEETSFLFPDPGEGLHQLMAADPMTLRKGINTFHFSSPSFCSDSGDSVHFGRQTGAVTGLHGADRAGLDAFKIKCQPNSNALSLDITASPNPINSGDTSNIWWDSQNAKSCVPSAGFFNGTQNDWQNMTPTWADLQTGNPAWPLYTTLATPFVTSTLTENMAYTLTCQDIPKEKTVSKTVTISIAPSGYNDPTCQDFEWDRVSSVNKTDSNYLYGDPAGHPSNVGPLDANGAPVPASGNSVEFDPVYQLGSGNHTIYMKMREPEALSDKLIVTNDLSFDPTGTLGEGPIAGGKKKIEIETENCTFSNSSNFLKEFDYTASNNSMVRFHYWDVNAIVNSSSYYVKCNFNIPAGDGGDYVVWGRNGVIAGGDDTNNGYWFAIDKTVGTALNFIRWEFEPVIQKHCLAFDFWAGDESDKGVAGNDSIAITKGDPLTLWWDTGNIQKAMGTMGASGLADSSWPGLKPSDDTPFAASHIPTPPPYYHSQTWTPLTEGTYKYELSGVFGFSASTETKTVTVNVSPSGSPIVVDGTCGTVAREYHCQEPKSELCTLPSTLKSPGVETTGVGWKWTCSGFNGGADETCNLARHCNWVEK